MKNRDKYAQEMLDIVLSDHNIAISRERKRPVSCLNYECENCLRRNYSIEMCSRDKLREWAEEEYQEPPILDEKEKEFLQFQYDHIKPKITWFKKRKYDDGIVLTYNTEPFGTAYFPKFKVNQMYAGLETEKAYTPEELGLKKRKAVFRLGDYKGISCCMHCNTEEKVKTFICFLDKEGRELASGERYIYINCFRYGSSTCLYFNKGTIGMAETAKSECFEILEFDDFRWEGLK